MGKVVTELSMSLDDFVAGPNDGPGAPLGAGGKGLFAWCFAGDTPLALPGVTHLRYRITKYLQQHTNSK